MSGARGAGSVLLLEGISFAYAGGREGAAVHDISLAVRPGEVMLLCGPSGCGKTTVTRVANGLAPHFYEGELTGEVRVCGHDVAAAPLWETARNVGSVFQNPKSQFYNVDVAGELAFGCENLGMPVSEVEARRERCVAAFDLKPLLGRSIFSLSGGQKQRIACSAATAHDPALVVLDEPSSNLDFPTMAQLRAAIERWRAAGAAVLVAEHRLHYLDGLVDAVCYMEAGRITRRWTGAEFQRLPREELARLGLRTRRIADVFRREALEARNDDDVAGGVRADDASHRSALHIRDLAADYRIQGARHEVLHVDALDIPQGSVLALVGHNGVGKSTFAEALAGLNHCRGSLVLDDAVLDGRGRTRTCFMVMQDVNHQLFAESVADEVLLSMAKPDEDAAYELLAQLGLDAFVGEHPLSLSGGERQRVALASALAAGRRVIIYDEPTSGLDLAHMHQVAATIASMRSRATQIVITHDPELIMACCTQVAVMEKGCVKESYPLDERALPRLRAFFRM